MVPVLNRVVLDTGLFDSDVNAWAAAIASAGGSVSASTVRAATTMVKAMKSAGVWDKVYMLSPCAGDQLTAALIRLKVPSGVARAMTNNNFVSGDYTERGSSGGLAGDGSSKYLDTLLNPVSQGWSDSSLMLWAYTRTTAAVGTSQCTIGATDGSNTGTLLGWLNSGSKETVVIGGGASERPPGSATSVVGFLGGGTFGDRSNQFYRNGAAVGAPSAATSASQNLSITAHALNAGGAMSAYCSRRLSTIAITQGLSSAELLSLYNAVLAFETALGRNV